MLIPSDLRYSNDHEWAKANGDIIRVGITDYAQDALGDVVFVDLPKVGAEIARARQRSAKSNRRSRCRRFTRRSAAPSPR